MTTSTVFNGTNHPVDLHDGRVIAAGEIGKADLSKPHNQALVDDGHLTVRDAKKSKATDGVAVPKETI